MVDLRPRLGAEETRRLLDHMDYPADVRDAKTAAVIQWYREHPDQPVLGALQDGKLVGFIALRLDAPAQAQIRQIAVHSGYRRQGIGRRMTMAVWQGCQLRRLSAETDQHGVDFYRRIGFTASSLGEKYPGTERFSCTLTDPVHLPVSAEGAEGGA
jgi:ribosomal protein S18 acetylase RimI-like enzyme